jgi:hypothetical protein
MEKDFVVFSWLERRYNTRLTRRGRLVVGWAIALAFLAVFALANYATTPTECRVELEQMSQFCKDLMYP